MDEWKIFVVRDAKNVIRVHLGPDPEAEFFNCLNRQYGVGSQLLGVYGKDLGEDSSFLYDSNAGYGEYNRSELPSQFRQCIQIMMSLEGMSNRSVPTRALLEAIFKAGLDAGQTLKI